MGAVRLLDPCQTLRGPGCHASIVSYAGKDVRRLSIAKRIRRTETLTLYGPRLATVAFGH